MPTAATQIEYYVVFWRRDVTGLPAGVRPDDVGWESEEYLVTGTTLTEVQAWIQTNHDDRQYELFIAVNGQLSARLLGADPTFPAKDPGG
ncbi:hypothetical protein ACVBEQ_24945 [Nakamurella sp. GG22]